MGVEIRVAELLTGKDLRPATPAPPHPQLLMDLFIVDGDKT